MQYFLKDVLVSFLCLLCYLECSVFFSNNEGFRYLSAVGFKFNPIVSWEDDSFVFGFCFKNV